MATARTRNAFVQHVIGSLETFTLLKREGKNGREERFTTLLQEIYDEAHNIITPVRQVSFGTPSAPASDVITVDTQVCDHNGDAVEEVHTLLIQVLDNGPTTNYTADVADADDATKITQDSPSSVILVETDVDGTALIEIDDALTSGGTPLVLARVLKEGDDMCLTNDAYLILDFS